MTPGNCSLMSVYGGWEGYQQSLVSAVALLTPENLRYRLAPEQRSVGEIAAHIAFGRIQWFNRMGAPGSAELLELAAPRRVDGEMDRATTESPEEIIQWLESTWRMVEGCLTEWTVDDLWISYEHPYEGKVYAVSRQWTIWRIMSHDIHHGGQLTVLLAAQGIDPPDLSLNGGHIVEPPVVTAPS